MVRIYEMRQKEVINIKDGCRFGFICDLEIDTKKGNIVAIIIPGPGRVLGIFGGEQEYRVEWDNIVQIGEDIILIEVDTKECLVDCD